MTIPEAEPSEPDTPSAPPPSVGGLLRTLALPPFLTGGRGSMATTLQLSLCAIVLVFAILVVPFPLSGDMSLFLIGAVILLALGCAVVLTPWHLISPWVLLSVPLADLVGITLLRQADPSAGFSLLFFVPAIWMSVFFGLIGYIISILVVPAIMLAATILTPGQTLTYYNLTFPLMIVLVATIALVLSRRLVAQQRLFERQTRTMARTLRRTQRQEELLAEVLDTVDFGVIRIAIDGSTTVANEAHARLQRAVRTADAVGLEQGAVFAADGKTPIEREDIPFARAARGEVFDNQIVWFGSEGGRRRALSITARRTYAGDGSDTGAVIVSRDVTTELTALRARDSLVSSVSHELRTPLTSIIGYLELAVDDPRVPAQARNNLEVAERNASRLLEIVSDILTASSRSEMSADLTISQQHIDLADLVRAAGESWRPAAAERAIEVDVDAVVSAPAYADPLRMRQVIDNLISNAVKYNRDGGVVSLRTHSDGLTTTLTVTDTGIGLSEESLGRLFERFFRADDANRGGTGLGLAISRDLVRAHGGDVTVTSRLGIGTTFSVRLPATAESLDGLTPAEVEPADVTIIRASEEQP
ncbi:MAG: PAS domain-containing sensor histidine kinase [Microbacterium sp.]|uniref:sensor histidine kinase n=1 Tax=Microbacterium sp. TaxID=51671 RepID=UPI0039E505DB